MIAMRAALGSGDAVVVDWWQLIEIENRPCLIDTFMWSQIKLKLKSILVEASNME
jgi:hypothetical protein